MFRSLALAILMVGWAAVAQATTRFISPVGSDSADGSTASLAGLPTVGPWRTFHQAIDNTNTGDTMMVGASLGVIASGQYADGIVPWDQYHNHRGVLVIGDSVVPNRVIVPSISVSPTKGGWDETNWQIVGIRVAGNVQAAFSYGYGNANGFLLRSCVVAGSFNDVDCDCGFYNCRIGTGHDSVDAHFQIDAIGRSITTLISGCTIEVGPLGTPPADFSFCIRSDNGPDNCPAWLNTVNMTNAHLTIFIPVGYTSVVKQTMFRAMTNSVYADNVITMSDSSGASVNDAPASQGLLFRDRWSNTLFARDTIILNTLVAGKGHMLFRMESPGGICSGSHGNVWRACVIKSNMPVQNSIEFDWQMQPDDSFCYNVVLDSTGQSRSGFYLHNLVGNGNVYRNTFAHVGSGGGAAMICDDAVPSDSSSSCDNWNGTLRMIGNIFYTRSTDTSSTGFAMAVTTPPSIRGVIDSDYNLSAHYGGAGARAVYGRQCGGTQKLYSNAAAYTALGIEQHSLYGSPRFQDSSFANFNPNLLSNSAALLGISGTTDIGARDLDRIRPYMVNDLRVIRTTASEEVLQLTATGDDSLAGTCVRYDLRYSTSTINAGNFGAATQVMGLAPPLPSGKTENILVTGLSSSTTYYFAVIAYDDASNPSAISNIAFGKTQTTGSPLIGHLPPD